MTMRVGLFVGSPASSRAENCIAGPAHPPASACPKAHAHHMQLRRNLCRPAGGGRGGSPVPAAFVDAARSAAFPAASAAAVAARSSVLLPGLPEKGHT